MKRISTPLAVLGALALLSAPSLADDVKLKNGKTIENVNVVKKSKTWYRLRQVDGKEIRIRASQVAEVIKKPTLWDEFKKRKKSLRKDDTEGLYELAMWAREKGLERDWKPTLKLVLKADGNHEAANKAMGNVLVDGKWLTEKKAEALRAKALASEYKARGWRQLGGRWLSKAAYSRAKMGWVQVKGHWVTHKQASRIKSRKLTWFEGMWLDKKGLAKAKGGYRMFEGRWLPIEDLEEMHREMDAPWKIRFGAVQVLSTCNHRKTLECVNAAEDVYGSLVKILGEEADVYGDQGPLPLMIVRDIPQYQATAQVHGNEQTQYEADHGNSFGVWYGSQVNDGTAFTYYFDQGYMRYWVGYGVAYLTVGRIAGQDPIQSPLMIALGGYSSALHDGSYAPSAWYFNRFLRGKVELEDKVEGLLDALAVNPSSRAEWRVPIGGFFLHYLQSRNPERFRLAMTRFLTGKESEETIRKTVLGEIDDKTLNQDYRRFAARFSGTYKPWKS